MADEGLSECLFERLRLHQQRVPESIEVARGITARINNRLNSHDKHLRQATLEKLWCKTGDALQLLHTILDTTRDGPTSTYIIAILREAICLKQGKGKKCIVNNANRQQCALQFISINGLQTISRYIITAHNKRDSTSTNEALLQDMIWILATLAPKDPKFPVKVRLVGAVRTLHVILKCNILNNKIIFPMLVIMKQLSKNPVTTSILVRDGVVGTYERVLVSLGCLPSARLRLCLDAINYFSRNRVCCMQIVKMGLCSLIIRVFDRWDRYEGRMRLKTCAHILQILQHLTSLKSGRRALCTKKHVQMLQRFCLQCPDESEFDGLLANVCSVITLCLKHQALPVSTVSPAIFNLNPLLKATNSTWPCHEDDEDPADSDANCVNSDDDQEYDVESEELDEDGEPINRESSLKVKQSEEVTKPIVKKTDILQCQSWITSNERDIEDLKKYSVYYREFGSYNRQVKSVKSRSSSKGLISEENNVFSSFLTNRALLAPLKPIHNYMPHADPDDPKGGTKGDFPVATSSSSSLKIYKDLGKSCTFESVYAIIATRVKSIIPFVKVAYPDKTGGSSWNFPEPLNKMERAACRTKLLSCVDRAINPDAYMSEVVYDLDQLCTVNSNDNCTSTKSFSMETITLPNNDEIETIRTTNFCTRLSFESRFESGNLRKAIQIGPREYELILMPDVNSSKRHQWFYFEVRNMHQGKPYVFNIINCEKSESQFNFGMKPVMYSVKEAVLGKPGWVRVGTDICYYRNSYHYSNTKNSKYYLTVTFTIEFPHYNDVCYIAYHFPFTYSMMMTRIWQWGSSLPPNTYFRAEPLCYSLNNNEVPLVTITADDVPANPMAKREIIFLTARVHPGESNASWVMDGTLNCLLSDTTQAASLRGNYIFKIVPMLNVEGVINGCHRCGLTNEDLNRRWSKPNPILHPTIYHTKGLIEYLVRVWKKPPLVYCDYHGHSRKKNVFFYGCASAESWCSTDRNTQDEPVKYLMLPALMHRISPAFALGSCSFRIERERESTARVTVWRHLGVTRSYTMETSFCGFDKGPYKGYHLNTQHLQRVGKDFCEALHDLNENAPVDLSITHDLQGNIIDLRMKNSGVERLEGGDSEGGSHSDSILRTDSDEDFD